jgi:hypothetical protein
MALELTPLLSFLIRGIFYLPRFLYTPPASLCRFPFVNLFPSLLSLAHTTLITFAQLVCFIIFL